MTSLNFSGSCLCSCFMSGDTHPSGFGRLLPRHLTPGCRECSFEVRIEELIRRIIDLGFLRKSLASRRKPISGPFGSCRRGGGVFMLEGAAVLFNSVIRRWSVT